MNTPKQKDALRKIDQLFGQIEKSAETTGVKPDAIAELLTFTYIDVTALNEPNVKSLSNSRRDVFNSYLNNKVGKTTL